MAAIEVSGEPGVKWIAAFDEIRHPWFNVSVGDGFYHYHRSWDDDRTVPFSAISHFVSRINSGEDIVRETEEIKAEPRGSAMSTGTCSKQRKNRAPSIRCSAFATTSFPTSKITNSIVNTGSRYASTQGCASSAIFSSSAG